MPSTSSTAKLCLVNDRGSVEVPNPIYTLFVNAGGGASTVAATEAAKSNNETRKEASLKKFLLKTRLRNDPHERRKYKWGD